MIFMFGDHFAVAASYGELLSSDTILIIRAVGRFVFPVYAYLCATGFLHSKDRTKYLTSLLLFAAVAQIPFLLLMSTAPFGVPLNMFFALTFNLSTILQYLPVCLFLLFCYYRYLSKKPSNLIIVFISLTVATATLSATGGRFYVGSLNVLYTFAAAVIIMLAFEVLRKNSLLIIDTLIVLISAFLAVLYIGLHSDYSILGILLVVAVYLCNNNKNKAIVAVIGFCTVHYLAVPLFLALSFISVAIIFFYNGKKGYNLHKYFFYAFYPAHLAVIGAIRFLF